MSRVVLNCGVWVEDKVNGLTCHLGQLVTLRVSPEDSGWRKAEAQVGAVSSWCWVQSDREGMDSAVRLLAGLLGGRASFDEQGEVTGHAEGEDAPTGQPGGLAGQVEGRRKHEAGHRSGRGRVAGDGAGHGHLGGAH